LATRAAQRGPRLPSSVAGYVLHQHDWSESSLIVDVFTRELGRLVVVARGAKRPYSQQRAVLLPFQRLSIGLGRHGPQGLAGLTSDPVAAADIHALRSAEWAGSHPMLRGAALFSGFYLNELLLKLLARQDPHPELFDAYAQAVAMLAALPAGHEGPVLRAFEWWLLREVGLLPDLGMDTLRGEPVDPTAWYRLTAETGLARREAPEPGTPAPTGLIAGGRLLAVQRAADSRRFPDLIRACDEGERDLKPALRDLLHYHLGVPVLRTRELLRELHGLSQRRTPSSPLPPASAPTR
jgi:DNA repair protein RecO (recombination protein O)